LKDALNFLSWYLAILVIGAASFPIAFRFFPRLASKGYAFTKPLGLLLWGYFFWLLCSLGILQNDLGGEVLAFILLLILSALALSKGKGHELWQWVRSNWKTILAIESVFLVFFVLWAVVRAANPEITGTEKPMELAFINAILKSPVFPPQDPWLSGYAISYYYFGYVLIAMLIRLTGVLSSVGYNLTSALWFGLTAAAVFGLVFDLVAFWKRDKEANSTNIFSEASKTFARWAGILGSFFVLIVSNIEGFLEILHSGGVFWQKAADGTLVSKFWDWLAIQDLNVAPTAPFSWIPSRYLVWWRGSRVLQDLNLSNARIEIIDEFPFFSYLLSDLHPHVLAMPFDVMAMGICLNLFIAGSEMHWPDWHISTWFTSWEFWLTALVLGSMAFFNTWDFPIYVGLFCLILIYLKIRQVGWSGKRILDFLLAGITYGVTGVVLFLPFFLTFKSQAGGFLPSMEYMTRGVHFWVMFAPLLIPIFVWLIHLWKNTQAEHKWSKGLQFSLAVVVIMWLLSSVIGLLFFDAFGLGTQLIHSSSPLLAAIGNKLFVGGQAFTYLHNTTDGIADVITSLSRRVSAPGTWITLTALLLLLWGILSSDVRREEVITEEAEKSDSPVQPAIKAETFVLFLVLAGVGLTLFPEYFYLRDQFGNRMNTIFKFYFQTWMFWGIAAAFATTVLWNELKKWRHALFTILWSLVIAAALVYPAMMVLNKTNSFKPQQWTLNGNAYLQLYHPDEVLAMNWLDTQPIGTVSEAVGGSYSEFARVSEQTGFPTVIGWVGHEQQWRGGWYTEIDQRQKDIQRLYETTSWLDAYQVIAEYNIRYVYVGYLEESTYHVSLNKFSQNLKVVYQNQSVTIYEVPEEYQRVNP
jgi:YYY domain-containing protein